MQFVIVSSSLGKMHGFIRHGEGTKFDLMLQANLDILELWFLTEPRRKNVSGAQASWSLIWRRRQISREIQFDTVEVRPVSYF